jgi:hypothetical protein
MIRACINSPFSIIISGRNARYTSLIAYKITPSRRVSGSLSRNINPVRWFEPNTAYNIFFILLSLERIGYISLASTWSQDRVKIYIGFTPIFLSTVYSSDYETLYQSIKIFTWCSIVYTKLASTYYYIIFGQFRYRYFCLFISRKRPRNNRFWQSSSTERKKSRILIY